MIYRGGIRGGWRDIRAIRGGIRGTRDIGTNRGGIRGRRRDIVSCGGGVRSGSTGRW